MYEVSYYNSILLRHFISILFNKINIVIFNIYLNGYMDWKCKFGFDNSEYTVRFMSCNVRDL